MPANRPSAALAHISMDAQRAGDRRLAGCAVLCVVLLHIQIHMPQEQSLLASMLPQTLFNIVFRSGYYGVIIFFVISGFLVTRSALERWGSLDAVPWRAFLLRRAAHLSLPAAAADRAGGAARAGRARFRHRDHQPRARCAGRAGHAPELAGGPHRLSARRLGVLWSLSVEEAFYLAFPLLCMLALATGERLLKLTLLLFVALGPFARVAFTDNEIWADHSYLSCLDGIAIGCLAALYSARARHVPTRLFMLCGGVLFALVFFLRKATYALGLTGAGLNVTALEIGAALLLIAWSRRRPSLEPPALCLAFLRWMGVNSYEIYLTHMFPVMLLASVTCRSAIAADVWCSAALSASAALAVLLSALLGSLVARYYSAPMRRRLTQLAGGLPRRRQARMRA